jgi:hypothetical protein
MNGFDIQHPRKSGIASFAIQKEDRIRAMKKTTHHNHPGFWLLSQHLWIAKSMLAGSPTSPYMKFSVFRNLFSLRRGGLVPKYRVFEFFVREVGEIVQPQGVRRCRLLHTMRVYVPQIILENREALIHFRHAFIRFLVLPHPRQEQVHKTLFRIQILQWITDDRIIQLNCLDSAPPRSMNYCKQQH